MSSFTLPNTPFPNGTSVSAYDATGYSSFPAGGPPGKPVATATVTAGVLTFTGLTNHVPYFAAAKVSGEWKSKRFSPGDNGPPPRLQDLDYADVGPGKTVVVTEDESGFEFGDAGSASETTLEESGKGFVNFGSDLTTARPEGFASIEWQGEGGTPENMQATDTLDLIEP